MSKKKRKPWEPSSLEEKFLGLWRLLARDWPAPVSEYRVVREEDTQGRTRYVTDTGRVRMWTFDFAWPGVRLAVEMEGGVHSHPVKCNHCGLQVMTKAGRTSTGKIRQPQKVMATFGGHTRGKAYIDNCHKYNTAHLLGWIVLRYTIDDVDKRPKQMVEEIQRVLEEGGKS